MAVGAGPRLEEESGRPDVRGAAGRRAADALKPLAPNGAPVARFMTATDSGYSFESSCPGTTAAFAGPGALPPSPLRRGGLGEHQRRRGRGGDGFGAPAARRGEGDDASAAGPAAALAAQRLRLSPRRPQQLRCGPGAGLFSADGRCRGRQHLHHRESDGGDGPLSDGFSPRDRNDDLFTRIPAPDIAVCGPPLAVRRGEKLASLADVSVSPALKVHPVKDGWLLADGPYTGEGGRYANNECGGCVLISLRVFYLAAEGGVPVTAFDDAWSIEDDDVAAGAGRNARVTVHPDLTAIDAYEADVVDERGRLKWSHVRHCYDADAHVFKECGRWPKAPPPGGLAMPPEQPLPKGEAAPAGSADTAGIADHREEFPPGLRIIAESTEHPAGHHGDPGFADAAAAHALVRRLDDDGDPERLQFDVDGVGDLHRQFLLNLQPPREGFDDADEFRDADDAGVGQICDVRLADNGREMMFAMAGEVDVAQQHHLVVAFGLLERSPQHLGGIIGVAGEVFLEGANDTLRRRLQPFPTGIIACPQQQRAHRLFRLGTARAAVDDGLVEARRDDTGA